MEKQFTPSIAPTEEQLLYAKILQWGMLIGLACLLLTFAVYVLGIMKPYIPLDEVSQYWGQSVHAM